MTRTLSTTCRQQHLRRSLALLLCAATVLMAGCIRYDLTVLVQEDGSGEVRLIAAVAEDWVDDIPGARAGFILADWEEIHRNARFTEYEQDGFIGYLVTIPFADLDELAEVFAGLDQDAAVTRLDDGTWDFSMSLGEPEDIVAGLSPDGANLGERTEIAAALRGAMGSGSAPVVIRVSLPGEPFDHNADRIENATLIWEPNLSSSGPFIFTASSRSDDNGVLALLGRGGGAFALAATALVLIVAFVARWRIGRGRRL